MSELTYTIAEFCKAVQIGQDTYYKLQRRGEGPRVVRLGRRVLITQEAARAWLRDKETPSGKAKEIPLLSRPTTSSLDGVLDMLIVP